jgi:hypothetical protein
MFVVDDEMVTLKSGIVVAVTVFEYVIARLLGMPTVSYILK